ncbi:MAG: hypothetical protein EOP04_22015, partial [Proteobacteria bacterium]
MKMKSESARRPLLELYQIADQDENRHRFKKACSPSSLSTLENILEYVEGHEDDEVFIRSTIRALAKTRMYELATATIRNGHDGVPMYNEKNFLFAHSPELYIANLDVNIQLEEIELDYAKDVILPWPWAINELHSAHLGKLHQSSTRDLRRSVTYYSELEIGFVFSEVGDHAAGIICEKGTFKADKGSLSKVFELYCREGEYLIVDEKKYKINDFVLIAIFELSKMLYDNKK